MKTRTSTQTTIRIACIVSTICTLLLGSGFAGDPALTPTVGSNPLGLKQNDGTAGWEFTLSQPLFVTDLGLFDANLDGFVQSHRVGIWNTSGSLLIDGTLPIGTGSQHTGLFRYVDVPDTLLAAGSYVVGAFYNNASPDAFPQNNDSITTFPGISYVQPRFGSGTPFPFPNNGQGTTNGLNHFGPNFKVAIPEPSTALFGLALTTLAISRRHRRP